MKKILAIVLAAAMLLSMTACGAAAKKDTYVVGICQLVQHDALDAATKGFQDALTEALGDKVSFEVQNASGESVNCTTIINGFVSGKVDLIMANATPALQAAASATSDIPILGTSVTQAACDASDVLYIPTDNTAASNTEAIANVVLPAKVPVIAGEAGICEGCGVATLSISYYDLGVATGKMAAKILTGEADISQMPVEYAPQVTKMYNAANCEALGVTIPDGYEPMG